MRLPRRHKRASAKSGGESDEGEGFQDEEVLGVVREDAATDDKKKSDEGASTNEDFAKDTRLGNIDDGNLEERRSSVKSSSGKRRASNKDDDKIAGANSLRRSASKSSLKRSSSKRGSTAANQGNGADPNADNIDKEPRRSARSIMSALSKRKLKIGASAKKFDDDSDEEEKDPRERIDVEVETVREAIVDIRTQDDEHMVMVSLKISCARRRLQAREKLKEAQEEHDNALYEFRRIQCDQYESQLQSVMTKAERNLERWEHILKQQHASKAFFDFGDEGAHTLAKSLKYKRTLERVVLPKNEIGHVGFKSLTSILSRCANLQHLDLRGNPLGPEGGEYLAVILSKCQFLKHLNLHDCGLGAKGVTHFIKAAYQRRIYTLNLRYNNLGREGGITIARDFLQDNDAVVDLDLANNSIGAGEAAEALAEAIDSATALRCLDLSHNNMNMILRRPKNRELFLRFRKDKVVGIWKSTAAHDLLEIVAPADH